MKKYTDYVAQAGDRVINLVGKAQDAYVSAVSTVSSTIGGYIPDLPQLPLVRSLPTPQDIVTTTFDLWEHALKSQKQYAKDFVKALSPVTEKVLPKNGSRKAATKASA